MQLEKPPLLGPWTGLFLLLCLSSCGPAHLGPPSDHFDGARFFNPEPDHSWWDTLKWLWEMETVAWPDWVDDPPRPRPVSRVGRGGLRATYVNQATVLIQTEGFNILTDPIWSFRAGPASWLGAKRIRAPGVDYDDLPPIDLVLISHDHYDHLDLATLKRLQADHHPRFITGLGVKRLLARHGVEPVVELDWWQSFKPIETGLETTFVPARHGSGRTPFRSNTTLWGGFIISAGGGRVYFAGDTAWGSFPSELAARFAPVRLAILPVGSYEKRWFMRSQHMNPEEAVRLHLLLKAGQSLGVHFATFAEHPEQPLEAHQKDLKAALREHGLPDSRFWLLGFGEGREVPPLAGEGEDG